MAQPRPNQKQSRGGWAYPDGTVEASGNPPRVSNGSRQRQQTPANGKNQRPAQKSMQNDRPVNNMQGSGQKINTGSQVGKNQKVPRSSSRNLARINVRPNTNPNNRNDTRTAPQNQNQKRPSQGQGQVHVNKRPASGKVKPMTVSEVRADRKKRRINPETSEIERKRRQREQFRIKKRRKDMLRIFAGRFILFLITFAVIGSLSSVVFAYNFLKTEKKLPDSVKYTIGEASEKTAYSSAVNQGTYYIDFSKIAEYLGFAVTGDTDKMNYIITDKSNEFSIDSVKLKEAAKTGSDSEIQEETTASDSEVADTGDDTTAEDDVVIPPTDSKGTGTEEIITIGVKSNRAWLNGQEITLGTSSVMRGKDLWVDIAILTYINGITVNIDEKKSEVSVIKNTIKDDDGTDKTTSGDNPVGNKPVYEFLSLKLKSSYAIPAISEDNSSPAVDFKADLSAYEEYMNPKDRDAYLTLINVDNPLDQTYIPPDLTSIKNTRDDGRETQKMREYPAKALEAMFIEMNANNIWNVSVTSGYRSYDYQVTLFNQKVSEYSSLGDEEARIKAATIVAVPGTSEHQSGLCCDMHNLTSADVSFANTGAYEWMSQNAHKFGFVVRFPEDKVTITKISYEPWHYRYVGRYHATRMYELGMCLEEYIEYINNS